MNTTCNPAGVDVFIATTDSAHNLPVFPNLAREMVPDDPNRLWSGEITDVTVASGFVYVALVLGALPWHLLAQVSLSDYPLRERAIELLHSLDAVFYGEGPRAVIHPSARCCETNAACTLVVKTLPG